MGVQLSTSVRNAMLDQIESTTGTSAKLQIRTGAQPANCAAAATGTLLAELTLPSDWMAAASGGTKDKAGTWSASASATGTAGHYRILDNAGTTCHEQGSVTLQVIIATSAATSANGNVLTFTSTTGVTTGMLVSGTGVVAGSSVVAVTSTTVTLSLTSTAGVASGASITFGGEITLDDTSIDSGQTVTIATKSYTAPHA